MAYPQEMSTGWEIFVARQKPNCQPDYIARVATPERDAKGGLDARAKRGGNEPGRDGKKDSRFVAKVSFEVGAQAGEGSSGFDRATGQATRIPARGQGFDQRRTARNAVGLGKSSGDARTASMHLTAFLVSGVSQEPDGWERRRGPLLGV